MYKGITPTLTLTLPEDINLDYAQSVYVTIQDKAGAVKMRKTGADLVVDENTIELYLAQEETLSFPPGAVYLQVNWTYMEGEKVKRAASDIVGIVFKANLESGVLE